MHNIQLVKIQPEERLAASSELNPASCLVTGCGEARGMGYWAATQVKGLSPEIFIVPEADVVVLTEGSTLIADSPIGTWQGDASPAGSETVARYQTDIMGTRETQSVLLTGVCAIKPINGKTVQTTLWESDQFIVPVKQGNACRGKGLAGARWPGRDTPSILRDGQGVSTKLWSITLRERRGCTPEEPDEGKLQVRFCEGAHSNLGLLPQKRGVLWALLDNRERKIWMMEKRIRRKKNRPLSREGWIMFLNDKINERYMTNGVLAPICFACALAGLSGIVAFIIAEMDVKHMHVLLIFAIVSLAIALVVRHLETKRVKPIEMIRVGIILEKEGFKTYDEIRDQCENAGVILTKNKNLFDKPDMDIANKKQKEVLQVSQSDIRDIKESLRGIEDINEVSLYSSNWHIFGSLLITLGFAVLSIGLAIFSIGVCRGDTNPSGIEKALSIYVLLISAGAFIIGVTYITGKKLNLYKKIKLLFFVILFLVCVGLVLIVL